MSKHSIWCSYKNYIVNADECKDHIQAYIPGQCIHIDTFVKNCYKKTWPASPDIMFIESERTIYVEFKSYTSSDEKNKDIEKRICNKIADMALIHHRFLKEHNKIPEKTEFWVVSEGPTDQMISVLEHSSGTNYSPAAFDRYKRKDCEGTFLFFDNIYVWSVSRYINWVKKHQNTISLPN